ncbi:tetratricopeptide repeat protein [Phanerochaete sordida]|uniref:Tetratricopeptide repeat protein n=1 Tax=Phanerochaete sordida TaxID=48140 RepID=A0A9P3LER7_9APHY|nr:tetratricopeptide repeat protein [Phanerochaete sordida]
MDSDPLTQSLAQAVSEVQDEPAEQPSEAGQADEDLLGSETPPSALVEPDVPDPFVVDDGDDDDDDEESHPDNDNLAPPSVPEDDETPAAEDEIALAQSAILEPPPLDLDKPVPPPPVDAEPPSGLAYDEDAGDNEEDESSEDDEPPELYLPGLILPTMFLPIPNTDPLTNLLVKYIPPERRPTRDVSGEWQHTDFHTLVMTNSWRALARMARDRIVASNPGDVGLILELWSLRLTSLARLRLFNQTSAELANLWAVLTSPAIPAQPPSPAGRGLSPRAYLWARLVPFELEVLHAKARYWAGDHMGYVDALCALVARCKRKAREAAAPRAAPARQKPEAAPLGEKARAREERRLERERAKLKEHEREREMWKERGARVCLILASQLCEMKEYTSAAKLLLPLAHQPTTSAPGSLTSPHILAAIGRIHLQAGDLGRAAAYFAQVSAHVAELASARADAGAEAEAEADPALANLSAMCDALLACAEGRFDDAERAFVALLRGEGEAHVATNNLAVALLGQGRLKEGIYVLEQALRQSPATLCAAEPFLFNLSTLYELRSNTAADKKRELLTEVSKWAGDGLRTACLKMPT